MQGPYKKIKMDAHLHIRVTAQELGILKERAKRAGYSVMSEYFRALARYQRPIKNMKQIDVMERDDLKAKKRALALIVRGIRGYDTMSIREIILDVVVQLGEDNEQARGTLQEIQEVTKMSYHDVMESLIMAFKWEGK